MPLALGLLLNAGTLTANVACGFLSRKIKLDSLEPPRAVLIPSRLEGMLLQQPYRTCIAGVLQECKILVNLNIGERLFPAGARASWLFARFPNQPAKYLHHHPV